MHKSVTLTSPNSFSEHSSIMDLSCLRAKSVNKSASPRSAAGTVRFAGASHLRLLAGADEGFVICLLSYFHVLVQHSTAIGGVDRQSHVILFHYSAPLGVAGVCSFCSLRASGDYRDNLQRVLTPRSTMLCSFGVDEEIVNSE